MDSTTEFYKGGLLPFITVKSNDLKGPINYLDIDAYDYIAGGNEGMMAAYRLMQANEGLALTTYSGEEDDQLDELFRSVIEVACEAIGDNSPGHDGRRGAAVGVLHSFSLILAEAARSGIWRATLMQEIADNKTYAQEMADEVCKNLDSFAELMMPSIAASGPSNRRATRNGARKAVAV